MTTKPTDNTPKFVQLRANKMVDDHVEPAQHRGEVKFFSIYLGKPGNYQWAADFAAPEDAIYAAYQAVTTLGCKLDRSQYDAVMSTSASVSQPEGHPHAALMAKYAKDAAETDTPWERWEVCVGPNQPWVTCIGHPNWQVAYSFRRMPALDIPAFAAQLLTMLRDLHAGYPWKELTTDMAEVNEIAKRLGIDPKESA